MKAVLQRVKSCKVLIDGELFSEIKNGVLVLLGIEATDDEKTAHEFAKKIIPIRLFNDNQGKMGLSTQDINGQYMVVPQITLCADFKKGRRPSFDSAMKPAEAEKIYEKFCHFLVEESGLVVKKGKFGARMLVVIENDGPVTFVI